MMRHTKPGPADGLQALGCAPHSLEGQPGEVSDRCRSETPNAHLQPRTAAVLPGTQAAGASPQEAHEHFSYPVRAVTVGG